MPSLGADMEAGTLVEWLVKPGDRVKRGDIVAVVETQKGAIEIEIFEAGKIEQILVGLNTNVPVGTPLARIQTEREEAAGTVATAPSPAAPVALSAAPPSILAPVAPPSPPAPPPAAVARRRVSPAARRLAGAQGIDLSIVTASGPAGAIIYADVERRLGGAVADAEKKRAPGLDLDAMRTAIAAAMARSKREIPHYYLEHQVDVTVSEQWLTQKNAVRPPDERLLIGALMVRSVALAARRFPAFNGFYRDGKFEPSRAVHVGVAIAIRGGGLAAPALHDADQIQLDELMTRMRDLVQRTRAGRIRSSEISDPTITVTSLGERGVETLYGIIYPPQVAILGFGKVVRRPWVIDGAIGPRSIVTMTLSADHRVSDGHAGALFLAEIGMLLQEPDKL
ncbi:MAG: dihydrolipoamide acetyltransferase family protein [Bradyrhizobium sp.]|uniref:dihydrolipoamide acetyltransferase family protein n=1 Tax=Bradyrhizobium sp. TaxID=376 RepID=UPI00271EA6A5|nr:dihydrolipoamide acetyltransferase family protein [Bradyrhizobium sp.]MDO9564512.1 dihydrolipoamide acetyltransferase family protein [Bradyrhizobium sp.]MDP3690697.1 dihydrolipoamide acetyltransferase family protein [Bradyrhizobium sp.]